MKIKYGYATIPILYDDDSESYGTFDPETWTITVSKTTAPGGDRVATVLHELGHAIFRNNPYLGDEEKDISTVTNALTEIFLRNPHFLRWIEKELHAQTD